MATENPIALLYALQPSNLELIRTHVAATEIKLNAKKAGSDKIKISLLPIKEKILLAESTPMPFSYYTRSLEHHGVPLGYYEETKVELQFKIVKNENNSSLRIELANINPFQISLDFIANNKINEKSPTYIVVKEAGAMTVGEIESGKLDEKMLNALNALLIPLDPMFMCPQCSLPTGSYR